MQTVLQVIFLVASLNAKAFAAKGLSNVNNDLLTPVLYQEQPLTIAINETSFPYHALDKQGNAAGLMVDMWRLWAQKQQVKVKFVVLPWIETLNQVASGKVDIHAGLSIIDSRRARLAFSPSIFSIYTNLYVHQKLINVNGLLDLEPFSIGVVKGSAHIDKLKKYHPELALKMYANRHDLYRGALNDEVLVFTGLEKLADDFPDYDKLRHRFPVHKVLRYQQGDYGVAVAKSNNQLLTFVNEGFAKISRQERSQIERKWLGLDKQKDSLLVAFAPQYPPYMSVTPSGEPYGLFVDVWRLWSKKVGVNVEFVGRDTTEMMSLIETQKADVLMVYPNNTDSSNNTLFADSIYTAKANVYLSAILQDAEGQELVSLPQFNKMFGRHYLGVLAQSTLSMPLLKQYPKLKLRYFNSFTAMLTAVENNEISGMIGIVDLINEKLVQNNLQSLFYELSTPLMSVDLAPVIHKQNKKLTEIINKGFKELDIKKLAAIEARWLHGNSSEHFYKQLAQKINLSEADKAFINSHGDIRLGIVNDLPPVEFINAEGKFSGINHDILSLISSRTDLNFKTIAFDSWQLLYQAMLNNEIDMLASITPTEERRKQALFSQSYWQMPWVMVHPQYAGRKTKLEDYYGKVVAIVKGYYLIAKLRQEHPLITFKLVKNRNEALLALQQERVDGFITTMATATQLLKQESIITLMMSMMDDVSLDQSHFAINKKSPALLNIIDKGLTTITEREKQNIYDNWFTLAIKTGLDKSVVLQVGAQIGVIILLIFAVVIIWNRRLQVEIKHREQLEKIMKHMATHDELTGLANRVLLKDRVDNAIAFHQRQSLKMALLFIDLDGFKNINDNEGHDVGDELLQQVAQRLQGCVRSSDTVVRFGGDEFVILLTGLHNTKEAAYVAEKILTLIQKQFQLSRNKASIGCSIGIAMYPDDGENETDLLKVADTVMYKVKATGKNNYQFNSV
jgi:diguanylate cyclase (GGDEF)-like protein